MLSLHADLHIHSVLSPCGGLEMSPNSIMQRLKQFGIQWLAITDHNSMANCPAYQKVAEKEGLFFTWGIEIQSVEEIHLLAYFDDSSSAKEFDSELYNSLLPINNDVDLKKLLEKHNIILPELSYSSFQFMSDNLEEFSLNYSPTNIEDAVELFLIQNLLFSVLIDADKHNAAGLEYVCLDKLNPKLCYSPAKLIEEKNKKQGALNLFRNQFIANCSSANCTF